MDEPLLNLDAKLRVATRAEIAALQQRLRITTLYVTHDQVEAMTMGDRVAVMKDGLLQQCDTPRRLYEDPVNAFVAGFIGIAADEPARGERTPDAIEVGGTVLQRPAGLVLPAGSDVTVGVLPRRYASAVSRRAFLRLSRSLKSLAPKPSSTHPW